MKATVFKSLLLGGLVLSSLSVEAHRAWIVPQETLLSGENRWVSFDAAVSNDIFLANHNAGRFSGVQVQAPDGSAAAVQNLHVGKYRTVFDLPLEKSGTYRVFTASSGLQASWEENGKRRMYPGRGETFSQAGFEQNVPKSADKLAVTQFSRRMETFVTLGAPSKNTLQPTNAGLELVAVTHPNELYAGEVATFKFLIDGKPAIGAEVTAIREGTRYRNSQEEIVMQANAQGEVSVKWNGAGRYFLEAEYQDTAAAAPATQRRGTYVVVLEVLPD
ncbi:DUF4198 domain-containing protein [Pseudoalteromonas fenneropenaei]|uniref:DUF4198 domain-containing protein n=1 Tax=Pseudoalteromonas fenneropenaei TaxID=1737459 RepID=A0ABV7CJ74_9GAMM